MEAARELSERLKDGLEESCSPDDLRVLAQLHDQLSALLTSRPQASSKGECCSSSPGDLDVLPDALVVHAMGFLAVPDLLAVMTTCKALRSVAVTTTIWRPLALCRWPWLGARPEQLPSFAPPESPHIYWEVYRRRMRASHEARAYRPPSSAQPRFTGYDLAVDLRHGQTGEILYSARGPLDDSFPNAIFEFQGWVLQPHALVVNRPLLFSTWPEVEAFFGDDGPLRLDFTLVDRGRRCMADLSSPSTMRRFTRCRRGWDEEGQGQERELWVFSCPDATFLSGALRLLRGLTVSMEEGARGLVCRVQSAWVCDHQYLDYPEGRPAAEVQGVIEGELRWV